MKGLLLTLLRAYKLGISPFLGQNCRFYPSCSEYAAEAIRQHGAARGVWLVARRLGKCHPWHPGGLDPVPCADTASSAQAGRCGMPDVRRAPAAPVESAAPDSPKTAHAAARGCGRS
jgi:putative membrane protein insertion efficiency factor